MDPYLYHAMQMRTTQINQLLQQGFIDDVVQLIRGSDTAILRIPDKTSWYIMHFAAFYGYTNIIQELIVRGINVVCWDNIGQTPLHKAASNGKLETMLILLANGAVVYTVDWYGRLPLEMAVEQHIIPAVELLLMCGCEPKLQNWNWTKNPQMSNDESLIFDLLKEYRYQVAGYKYGGMSSQVSHINTNSTIKMKEVGVTVDTKGKNSNFLILVRRLQAEYTDIMECIQDGQILFTDVIDFRTWKCHLKEISFDILVEDSPGITEDLVFVANGGVTGKVNNLEIIEKDKKCVVSVTVKIAKSGTTRFAIACTLKKQVVSLSSKKTTIVANMEPGAVIDIPEGTFSSPDDMKLQVIETEEEDDEGTKNEMLLSNIMSISMSNGSQPKKEITVTLPVRNCSKDQECVVLTTSKEEQESQDDWSILPVQQNDSGKDVAFSIVHFSIYSVVHKACDVENATKRIVRKSRINEKFVKFAVLAAPPDENKLWPVVVVCASRRLQSTIKEWERKGYDIQGEISDAVRAVRGQIFTIKIDGNAKGVAGVDNVKIYFQKDPNYRTLELRASHPQYHMEGMVNLFRLTKGQVEIVVAGTLCCGGKKGVKPFASLEPIAKIRISALRPTQAEEEWEEQLEREFQQQQHEHELFQQLHRERIEQEQNHQKHSDTAIADLNEHSEQEEILQQNSAPATTDTLGDEQESKILQDSDSIEEEEQTEQENPVLTTTDTLGDEQESKILQDSDSIDEEEQTEQENPVLTTTDTLDEEENKIIPENDPDKDKDQTQQVNNASTTTDTKGPTEQKGQKAAIPIPVFVKKQDDASSSNVYIPEDHISYEEEDHKDQSTIPALTFRSFRTFMKDFTPDDARFLGTQLGMSQKNIQKLTVRSRGDVTIKRILVRWRGLRPHRTQVFTLVKALKACGMHERADRVLHAFESKTFIAGQ